jgi:hypothetical protein
MYKQGVFMSRFQHLMVSFWRKDQGLGMVEAALTLPLLLLVTLGLMEFGSMYLSRHQSRDVADAVADFLQANPTATSGDLQSFVSGLGFGALKNTGTGQENSIYNKIKIKSSQTFIQTDNFNQICNGSFSRGTAADWANPWPAGVYKPYYIHVCYPYTYHAITSLPRLTAGGVPDTKTLDGKAIASAYPIVTCPTGQFLNNNTGFPVCTQLNTTCPEGQYLVSVDGATPTCKIPSINIGSRYRPVTTENDCTDHSSSVQVGMSTEDRVWCANLTVQ